MTVHDLDRARVVGTIVAFAGGLRGLGVSVGVSRVELAVRALASVDSGDREQAYWALRCALISDREHADAFDVAFAACWDGERLLAPAPEQAPAGAGGAPSRSSASAAGGGAQQEGADGAVDEADAVAAGRRWSAIEHLRELDFRAYGPDELARASRLVTELARRLPRRRSRRLRQAHTGPYLDRRETLRRAIRTEGHPVQLAWRRTSSRPRRLVFAVDVSGSMEPYARPVLMFLQAARQASRQVEAFAFGTRLTRLTGELGGRRPDAGLERAARAVPDWAGGTRIGENLKRLNDVWGRRGITRGAVVVVVSDGWERGDVDLLARQMERLQRVAQRTVWVNPLAGDPDYEPLVAGMASALPHVDVFLPGHNLRSLEALVAVLVEPVGDRPRRHAARGVVAGSRGEPAASEEHPSITRAAGERLPSWSKV